MGQEGHSVGREEETREDRAVGLVEGLTRRPNTVSVLNMAVAMAEQRVDQPSDASARMAPPIARAESKASTSEGQQWA